MRWVQCGPDSQTYLRREEAHEGRQRDCLHIFAPKRPGLSTRTSRATLRRGCPTVPPGGRDDGRCGERFDRRGHSGCLNRRDSIPCAQRSWNQCGNCRYPRSARNGFAHLRREEVEHPHRRGRVRCRCPAGRSKGRHSSNAGDRSWFGSGRKWLKVASARSLTEERFDETRCPPGCTATFLSKQRPAASVRDCPANRRQGNRCASGGVLPLPRVGAKGSNFEGKHCREVLLASAPRRDECLHAAPSVPD